MCAFGPNSDLGRFIDQIKNLLKQLLFVTTFFFMGKRIPIRFINLKIGDVGLGYSPSALWLVVLEADF